MEVRAKKPMIKDELIKRFLRLIWCIKINLNNIFE